MLNVSHSTISVTCSVVLEYFFISIIFPVSVVIFVR